ncbi:MAG: HAMP domain-containing sensor histidine kinase [Bacillota bacterium]|nr:HAMP domain-containing sensor histidine kinase [Bacillota bacterium]
MIYRLRKKFVGVSAISLIIVLSLIFVLLAVTNRNQVNRAADALADELAANNGTFSGERDFSSQERHPPLFLSDDYISEEAPFSTRFFTVWMDSDGTITEKDLSNISSISEEQAEDYAKEAIQDGSSRGWISDYRYKVSETAQGKTLVFVDASINRMMSRGFLLTAIIVLMMTGLVIFFMIFIFSGKVVKPVAESYEKQKQFVTNANHELKTPLALIMANLDIVEMETGKSEWLNDIRYEGERMNKLVNQMISLTRMDENEQPFSLTEFDFSEMLLDMISEFETLASKKDLTICRMIERNVKYKGNENDIRQLFSILMDNAIKYCVAKGMICISLKKKKNLILTIENSYDNADQIELEKLFDRFYRSDKARTYSGGSGIGLSIGKAIVQQHHGSIQAYQKYNTTIGFKVVLK